jgi:hypothetical protein
VRGLVALLRSRCDVVPARSYRRLLVDRPLDSRLPVPALCCSMPAVDCRVRYSVCLALRVVYFTFVGSNELPAGALLHNLHSWLLLLDCNVVGAAWLYCIFRHVLVFFAVLFEELHTDYWWSSTAG